MLNLHFQQRFALLVLLYLLTQAASKSVCYRLKSIRETRVEGTGCGIICNTAASGE